MANQYSNQAIPEISVEELAVRLEQSPENLQLIDVREPREVAICSIEGFQVLPLSEFTDWAEQVFNRFEPHTETLVLCHHGMRSAQMCQWLISRGFTNVKNIAGGIDAYSVLVDQNVPRY